MTKRCIYLAAIACAVATLAAAPADLPEPRLPLNNPNITMGDLFDCLHGKTTIVSAHRGGPQPGYPENAMETFAHSLSQAPVLFEADVRTSADGVLVLMHDATLDRTTTGKGKVADHDWASLSRLRLKDNDGKETKFAIPRLEEVLRWIKGRGLIALDMKPGAETEAVAAMIRKLHAEAYAGVIAYSLEQAQAFHQADPDLTIIYPIEKAGDFAALRQAGVPDDRIMAWMGIGHQRPHLWKTARDRGMPLIYGTLFFGDYAMTMTGNYRHFADLAGKGIDILPTDYHLIAYERIATVKNTEKALRACRATP